MTDVERGLHSALGTIDPGWSATDTEYGLALLRVRVERRKLVRRAAVGFASAVVGVALVLVGVRLFGSGEVSARVEADTPIRFADGSRVRLLDLHTNVSVVEARPERIVTSVAAGRIDVEVAPNPGRVFRVLAGDVAVEALGTAFLVERAEERVHVLVRHGRVRVEWPRGSRELGAGEEGAFPPTDQVEAAAAKAAHQAAVASGPSGAGPTPKLRVPSWQDLAREGKNADAYALLKEQGKALRDPEELLLAADVARLSGHAGEAVPFLERLLRERGGDPRAPLAAFALGRVLMTGQPEKAALAFADARRRARGGSLAEDALAREVEAWSRAGAKGRARERAEEYLRLYPKGQRVRAVKTFSGIE